MAGARDFALPTPNEPRTYVAPGPDGVATGTTGADDIYATGAGQTLVGNGGDDVFNIGTHTDAQIVVPFDRTAVTTVKTWAPEYTLADGVDDLYGLGDYAHHLIGNGRPNWIQGAGGNDVIEAGGTNHMAVGNSLFVGGAGRDTFVFRDQPASYALPDFQTGADGDVARLEGLNFANFDQVKAAMTESANGTFLQLFPTGAGTFFEGKNIADFTADNFSFINPSSTPTPTPTPTPTEQDTLVVRVAEDAYQGDAQFTVDIDGQQVGGVQTATSSHADGQWQDVTLSGDFGAGPHTVQVNFVNDAWGGSTSTDRNLYVDAITFDGARFEGEAASNDADQGLPPVDPNAANMYSNGTLTFSDVTGSGTSSGGDGGGNGGQQISGTDGPDTLTGTAGDDTISGQDGDDVLTGKGGNDTLDGGHGNDLLTGGDGADAFAFTNFDGHDTITDFSRAAGDKIALDYGQFLLPHIDSFERLQFYLDQNLITETHTDNSLTLNFGSVPGDNDTLTIQGISDLQASDWTFTGSTSPSPSPSPTPSGEGPTPTPSEPRSYVAPDGSGTAHGTSAAEDIFATGDNQTLIGGGGDDIFHVGTYSGLTIDASGPGITTVSTWGNFILGDGVDNLTANGDYSHSLTGNALANVITGAGGNDTIYGAGGNDLLIGGGGNDVFRFTGFSGSHIADWSEGDQIDLRGLVSGDDQARFRVVDDGHGNASVELSISTPFEAPNYQHIVTLDHVAASSIDFHSTFILG